MSEQMRTFSFEGNTLEQMHGWMQSGAGLNGIVPTIQALRGLATDLESSVDGLRRALNDIGVGWEGAAGEGAALALGDGETWGVESQEPLSTSAQGADGVADGFVTTRGRMPSPAEAQLSGAEHAAARAVPILGPLLDQALSDRRRDQVTNEARRHMNDWQDNAQQSVGSVRPLPPVPQPVVEGAPPRPVTGGEQVVLPDSTVAASAAGTPSVALVPGAPGGGGGSPAAAAPPPAIGSPGLGTAWPPLGAPPPVAPTPPVVPAAGAPAPVTAAPPARPAAGMPLMPLPIGTPPGDDTAGRRRAYGPGAFNANEIARSRGAAPAGMKGGVLGAAAGEGGAARPGGARPAGVEGGTAGRGGAAAHGAGGTAGRGGSIMQPAVGAGAPGEDDDEHRDKYAVESDEYFVGEPHKVAPPVIGG